MITHRILSRLSGGIGPSSIISFSHNESCNDGQDISIGSVNASSIMFTYRGDPFAEGDDLLVYEQENGIEYPLGQYKVESIRVESENVYTVTAYDNVRKLDKDVTEWLRSRTEWPCRLRYLVTDLCTECGVEFVKNDFPNMDYPVQKFQAEGITGRQLMQWAGEIACRFVVADIFGKINLAWYYESGITYALDERDKFYLGSLKISNYTVNPIDKVQIRLYNDDKGVVYPDTAESGNTYTITGNYLLSNAGDDLLPTVAQNIHAILSKVAYTPLSVDIIHKASSGSPIGKILTFADYKGREITTYVMGVSTSNGRSSIRSTGNETRVYSVAHNNVSYKSLSGKVLRLKTDVDGIRSENSDMKGNMSVLQQRVDSVSSTVQANAAKTEGEIDSIREKQTELSQNAERVRIDIASIQTNGVDKVKTSLGYEFNDSGLHIQKSGQPIANRIDNTGMYVDRSGKPILEANADGVKARDLKAENYLIIGGNSRLEDYKDEHGEKFTACFWIGGGDSNG